MSFTLKIWQKVLGSKFWKEFLQRCLHQRHLGKATLLAVRFQPTVSHLTG